MFSNNKFTLDLRYVCLVLVALFVGTVVLWKPWQPTISRTVQVSGEATQKAEPDQFLFTPMYQKKGSDRAAIQTELVAKVNEVIAKLKELGVAESDITLASATYDNYWNDGAQEVTSNSLTVTITNKELSQKVQDYLLTTAPEGQVSAIPSFSNEKRKEVEASARTLALADAKKKAETTVSELGAKLGKVVSIEDQQGGLVFPYYGAGVAETLSDSATRSSLPVLPGKQDVSYTVRVTYEIR